ncbi:MAG: hypothetical protein PHC34_08070 [Candidatus Gastranaerophilales bacterium]|nr:hypothetical protein [Candidatus Gastranaerophilales bacterium]
MKKSNVLIICSLIFVLCAGRAGITAENSSSEIQCQSSNASISPPQQPFTLQKSGLKNSISPENQNISAPSMAIMPRVGADNQLETPVITEKVVKVENRTVKEKKKKELKELNYADLDIKRIADELKDDLNDEKPDFISDLKILWEAAVERSETIRFAILKLSNPNGEQEKKGIVKRILTPLASVAPLIGAGSPDPVTGGGAIFGGSLLSSLLADNSMLNTHLSKVTDTDLVLLAQEIDNLQQNLVTLYYNYLNSCERLELADKVVENRYRYYQQAEKSTPEIISIADVFYREAIDMQYKSRQEVLSSRAALEQFVGSQALIAVDKNIKDRLAKLP